MPDPSSPPVCAAVGVGPGLGVALARRFARGGYAVLGLARDPSNNHPMTATQMRRALGLE